MASFVEERRPEYAGFSTRELAVSGAGPTVVMLHEFGDTAETWRKVLTPVVACCALELAGVSTKPKEIS